VTGGGGGTDLGLLLAFVGGLASFASPCFLPLLPAYLGYVVGSSGAPGEPPSRDVALRRAGAFVLGFSVVFVALWAGIAAAGHLLGAYLGPARQVVGLLIIVIGLHVAGVVRLGVLARDARLPVGAFGRRGVELRPASAPTPSDGRAFVLGVAFAAGWTPCIGPILGGIVGLASLRGGFVEGTALLAAYAAGLAVPFVLAAVGATALTRHLGRLRRHERAVSLATGGLIAGVGVLMVTNLFGRLSGVLSPFGG
jgi:cytochrome c-type biogenesis protein